MDSLDTRARPVSRRALLAGGAAALVAPALAGPRPVRAQDAPAPAPFSFDLLTEDARTRAAAPAPEAAPAALPEALADLSYDDYNLIAFRPGRAVWGGADLDWQLMPFHLGWLFDEPARLHEVSDGVARELRFTTDDFEYRGRLQGAVPSGLALPGIAGFKLIHPLNTGARMDEVISFVGASYFRALGVGTVYGASARGLALDSGLDRAEEFPRFSAFWVERPAPGARAVTIWAALDSASAAGACRFVLTPGVDTVVETTLRLFLRNDVEQLGVAPLTSMFLFSDVNRAGHDDYRGRVHDSNGLRIVQADGDVIWRALDNPPALASSYYAQTSPRRFGLNQRGRDFAAYQDAGARYDLRPSVEVEPLGDWGAGTVRLFELPTDTEVHDNIGAFWIPDAPARAGDALEFAYRLHWGRLDPDWADDLAIVAATRAGAGGPAGLETPPDTHKFVVDFQGGLLGRLEADDAQVKPVLTMEGGEARDVTLFRLPEDDGWRLVFDVAAEPGAVVEMTAHVAGYARKLSEIWSFQWTKP